MSFELIVQSIEQLTNLKNLTIEATGTLDLMNGFLWESYIKRSGLQRMNFKFLLASFLTCDQDKNSLLETFR